MCPVSSSDLILFRFRLTLEDEDGRNGCYVPPPPNGGFPFNSKKWSVTHHVTKWLSELAGLCLSWLRIQEITDAPLKASFTPKCDQNQRHSMWGIIWGLTMAYFVVMMMPTEYWKSPPVCKASDTQQIPKFHVIKKLRHRMCLNTLEKNQAWTINTLFYI